MPTFDELDKLSTDDLHHQATSYARKHGDIDFFWELLKAIPAAEAAAGNLGEAEEDIVKMSSLIHDFFHADEGTVGEALRPLYIQYLLDPKSV